MNLNSYNRHHLPAIIDRFELEGEIVSSSVTGIDFPVSHAWRFSDSDLQSCSFGQNVGPGRGRLQNCSLQRPSFRESETVTGDFIRTNFESLTAINSAVSHSLFDSVGFSTVDHRSSRISQTVFSNTTWNNVDLSWSEIENTTFYSIFSSKYCWHVSHTSFVDCVFINAQLNQVSNFDMASFENCHFIGCTLQANQSEYLLAGKNNLVLNTPRLVETKSVQNTTPSPESGDEGEKKTPEEVSEKKTSSPEASQKDRFRSIEVLE